MKRIAIVVAMQSEFDLIKQLLTQQEELNSGGSSYCSGMLSGRQVLLAKSGIGKVNAALQVQHIIEHYAPDYLINSGVAGGIGHTLSVGDVVVGSRCVYHDVWCGDGAWGQVQGLPLYYEGDSYLLHVLESLHEPGVQVGLICTGDQFITEQTRLKEVLYHFPEGLAVDMESCAMAQVCYLKQTPFISIRVISDTPFANHDNTAQYFDFWKDAPQRTFHILQVLLEQIA